MTLQQLFEQTNSAYRGTDDDAPVTGSTDYTLWLDTANRKLNEYATDPNNQWSSLFEIRSMGTISVNQDYELDDDFMSPSDKIIVTTTDGQDVDYTLVKPAERGLHFREVYIAGRDPEVLSFVDTITSTSQIVGGTLKVPAYFIPDDLTKASDTVPVNDPFWLVYAVAAELSFNDLTYADKAPDLVAKANDRWTKMAARNRRGTNDNPRVARTNVKRIRGVR